MKKIILYVTLAFILINISVETKAFADTINQDLNEMTDVRIFEDEENNKVAANEILERLNHIDARILKNVNNSGTTLILSDAKLVDLPEFDNLKGVVPRGHTEPWDDIPGLGGYISYVAIGKSEPSIENNHGDINLELHEFGHIVDMYAMPDMEMSQTNEFIEAHVQDKDNMFPGNEYFEYRDEYFAEVFAYYYLTEESRDQLYQYAPATAKYLEAMHNKVFTITDITSSSFKVEWDNIEEASYYTVVVNDETYDQYETNLHFDGLMGNSTYNVQIFAKDENDEVVEESYQVEVMTDTNGNVDETELLDAYNHSRAVKEENRTERLMSLEEKTEEMFDNIDLGRISQAEVNQLVEEIENEINKIEKEEEEAEEEAEATEVIEQDKEAEMPTKEESKPSVLPKVGWIVGLALILAIVYIIFLLRRKKVGNKDDSK